ncbi:hypothetical protein C8R45DRAFT_1089315 [Mycena sanguinolenta]|nr:hypothetical protein C8R45DRAFT_1089315 [Mycena sanguinolenta]
MLVSMDPVHPHDALFQTLYHSVDPVLASKVMATVDMYLGLPNRCFAFCYPGEHPTSDEKCPACGLDCRHGAFAEIKSKTGHSVGDHIHGCLTKSHQNVIGLGAEEGTTFDTRVEFVKHIEVHIKEMDDGCQWSTEDDEGAVCGETEAADWQQHFAVAHSVNVARKITVNYSVLCPEWHVDHLGDGSVSAEHCWMYYKERFQPFSERAGDDVDSTPIDVKFFPAAENVVQYQIGTGFDGEHPEFHGGIVDYVPVTPMSCLFCLWDDELDIAIRWTRYDTFVAHLQTHDDYFKDDGKLCPVPSCGTHTFTRFELETHIVAFHRPRLLSPEPEIQSVDVAHLEEHAEAEPPQPAKLPKAIQKKLDRRKEPSPASAEPVVRVSSAQRGEVRAEKPDQGKDEVVGDIVLAIKGIDPSKTGPKTHLCIPCRKQFVDILDHVDDCRKKRDSFCVITYTAVKGVSTRKNGPTQFISKWRTTQNGKANDAPASEGKAISSSKRSRA